MQWADKQNENGKSDIKQEVSIKELEIIETKKLYNLNESVDKRSLNKVANNKIIKENLSLNKQPIKTHRTFQQNENEIKVSNHNILKQENQKVIKSKKVPNEKNTLVYKKIASITSILISIILFVFIRENPYLYLILILISFILSLYGIINSKNIIAGIALALSILFLVGFLGLLISLHPFL